MCSTCSRRNLKHRFSSLLFKIGYKKGWHLFSTSPNNCLFIYANNRGSPDNTTALCPLSETHSKSSISSGVWGQFPCQSCKWKRVPSSYIIAAAVPPPLNPNIYIAAPSNSNSFRISTLIFSPQIACKRSIRASCSFF